MRLNLIAARHNKNMSQQELAEMVGVSRQAICRLERGSMNGSEKTWRAIASALKTAPEELWHRSHSDPATCRPPTAAPVITG